MSGSINTFDISPTNTTAVEEDWEIAQLKFELKTFIQSQKERIHALEEENKMLRKEIKELKHDQTEDIFVSYIDRQAIDREDINTRIKHLEQVMDGLRALLSY